MAAAFKGTYIIVLNVDDWQDKLTGTGFVPRTIPVFYAVDDKGKPTGRKITGDDWGKNKDTPEKMAPVLAGLRRRLALTNVEPRRAGLDHDRTRRSVLPAKTRPQLSVVRTPDWRDASDAALAGAAIEGAAGAAGAVWDRYAARTRAVLRRILGPSVDVEDLLQESFFQAFKDLSKLRERDKLQAFIVGVAVRMARSELRRRRLRRWLLLGDDGAPPDAAAEEIDGDAREAVRRLYALLDRFDDQSRAIFALRYIEGLELGDVAAALEISLATTKRYLVKVTARVRKSAANDPVLAAYVDRVTPLPPEASDG